MLTTDLYTKGRANASVTGLMQSPRVSILARHNQTDEDVIDRLWTTLGTAWHMHAQNALCEYNEDYIVEERYFTEISGWIISGQIDLQVPQDDGSVWIYDWKVTTSSKIEKGYGADWEKQINSYAYILNKCTGKKVSKARVVAILRDYKRNLFKAPQPGECGVKVYDIQLWPKAQQEAYLRQRVRIHQDAEMAHVMGEPLPECSWEEQWRTANKYAVVKNGRKRAIRVHDTEEEAVAHAESLGDASIEPRYGVPKKCQANYCGVSRHCDQYKKEKLIMITTGATSEDQYGE